MTIQNLPPAEVGIPYPSWTLSAGGGTDPHTLTVSGTPAGMSYDGVTELLTGSPANEGVYALRLDGADVVGETQLTKTTFLALRVLPQRVLSVQWESTPVALKMQSLTVGDVLTGSESVIAVNGNGTYTFGLQSGAVPTGLTLATDGEVTGTVNAGGVFAFSVSVTDSLGRAGEKAFTLTITGLRNLTALAAMTLNVAYSSVLATAPDPAPNYPVVWSILAGGTLPTGVTLVNNAGSRTATLAGTPTQAGTFTGVIQGADFAGKKVRVPYSFTLS